MLSSGRRSRPSWFPRSFTLLLAALVPLVAVHGTILAQSAGNPPSSSLVLIGNGTGVADLDSATVRAIFRGERSQWPSNRPVTIILPSARTDFAESLARLVFRNSPSGMQRYWLALVFQGRAAPPVFLDSPDDIVAFVRRTPGAIAMVPAGTGDQPPRELVIRVR